jgi:hypothetical protein
VGGREGGRQGGREAGNMTQRLMPDANAYAAHMRRAIASHA